MKTQINPKQINLFDATLNGNYKPIKNRFYGKYVKSEKHQRKLRGQAEYMIRKYCNGEFLSTVEWVSNTGFAGADRILRKIANGEFPGYGREEKRSTELGSKYRIIKLDK